MQCTWRTTLAAYKLPVGKPRITILRTVLLGPNGEWDGEIFVGTDFDYVDTFTWRFVVDAIKHLVMQRM